MPVIRDEKHQRELIQRLRRVEGQLRGIQAMIREGVDCERVTQQLSAARRALDKAFFAVLACAIREPVGGSGAKASPDRRVQQASALLEKFG